MVVLLTLHANCSCFAPKPAHPSSKLPCVQCGYDGEVYQVKHRQDAKRKDYLRKKGYQVEEIWEHELQTGADTFSVERFQ